MARELRNNTIAFSANDSEKEVIKDFTKDLEGGMSRFIRETTLKEIARRKKKDGS